MCTVVILHRPGHPWPLLLAANRDELESRPWRPPARHWEDREGVTAGLDELAGGTWLGMNDRGMVAAVLNRAGTLGPAENKRSRGELPLEALDFESAEAAVDALKHLDPAAYRPFNMVVADAQGAFCLAARAGEPDIHAQAIGTGLFMLSAHDLNDTLGSARIRHFAPKFQAAAPPDPDVGAWETWEVLLASRDHAPDAGPDQAMTIDVAIESGRFGTRSSTLIALPAPANPPKRPVWRFCHGAADTQRWTDIPI